MEHDGALAWSSAGATGIEGARRYVARATELLRSAGDEDWRGVAAQAFGQRLATLLDDCGRLAAEVEEAHHALRSVQAELATARAALPLASRWGMAG